MNQKPLFLALFCLLAGFLAVGLALAQTSSPGAPSVSQTAWWGQVLGPIKSYLAKGFVFLVDTGKGLLVWLKESVFKAGWDWLKTRGEAIKQGIEEEKQELKQVNPLRFLQDYWQKLKEGVSTVFSLYPQAVIASD